MAQTAAQRAVDVFVSAVQARGGKAEVQTKGSVTLVVVTVNGRTETLRVKGTTTDTWQARKSEATAKAPVTAWALVDLSDGAPIALVGADEYAAHVAKLAKAWEGKNPGKSLTANTTLAVTADDVASWEDAWGVIGLADAAPAAATIAEKPAEKAATNSTPAKKAPAKKAPAKKAPAKKAAAKKAPAKTAPAKAPANAAKKAPAKTAPAKKAPAKAAAPVKASDAKITPIAEQKDAASKAKAPASISTPKDESPAKPAAKSSTPDAKAAESAPKGGKKKSKKDDGASGIGAVLKRIPVVGRLL